VVLNALWAGAQVHMMERFDARKVWEFLCDTNNRLSVFMAVPTVYVKLISEYHLADRSTQLRMEAGCRRLRLMVSGSAALPETVMSQWQVISGHKLLERYGMTEIGMALSNPLKGERIPVSLIQATDTTRD
jgi:malonyl-CoA/methylmalonyl-CoA synthetase